MKSLLLLGVGAVGHALNARVKGSCPVRGTTRNPARIFEFDHAGMEPIIMPCPAAEIISPLADGAHVVVSFAPGGKTDEVLSPACAHAAKIVYISDTGVYDLAAGTIDDTTAVAPETDDAHRRVEAERIWLSAGAIVLRCPAIYGTENGLHMRLRSGAHRIPGDGSHFISRIHIDDLVSIILAALTSASRGETFVVGDLSPAPHIEVVTWLCQQLDLPLPEHIPLEEAPLTMRGNRCINPSRALATFGITLKYPSYREGFLACIKELEQGSPN
jgi:nucleoside-diphosphate-sugar epimerase